MRLATPPRRSLKPSLIPLIDVMLVLLFFFMLASTYVEYARTPLNLAPGGASANQPDAPGVMTAELLATGLIRVNGNTLSPEDAIEALRPATEVRLTPAPGVPLQILLIGWDRLAEAGLPVQLAEGAR